MILSHKTQYKMKPKISHDSYDNLNEGYSFQTGKPGITIAKSNSGINGVRAKKKYVKTGKPIGKPPRVKREQLAQFFIDNPYANPCDVKAYFDTPTTTAHTYVLRYKLGKYKQDIAAIKGER